jgi:hypothetical protein
MYSQRILCQLASRSLLDLEKDFMLMMQGQPQGLCPLVPRLLLDLKKDFMLP